MPARTAYVSCRKPNTENGFTSNHVHMSPMTVPKVKRTMKFYVLIEVCMCEFYCALCVLVNLYNLVVCELELGLKYFCSLYCPRVGVFAASKIRDRYLYNFMTQVLVYPISEMSQWNASWITYFGMRCIRWIICRIILLGTYLINKRI